MQGFPSKEEEDAARAERYADEEERKAQEYKRYLRVAGKGYQDVQFCKAAREKDAAFKQRELDIMREDIRALKDVVNELIKQIKK